MEVFSFLFVLIFRIIYGYYNLDHPEINVVRDEKFPTPT